MIKLSKKKLIIVLIISFLIVVLQIPQYLLLALKPASAANNYIDNVKFYCENDHLYFQFDVKTTFNTVSNFTTWWEHTAGQIFGPSGWYNYLKFYEVGNSQIFTAGNNYKLLANGSCGITNQHYVMLNGDDGSCWPQSFIQGGCVTEKFYFTEKPTLTVNYPQNNAEIAGNFNITGTITQPSPYEYNELWTYVYFYNPWQTDINYGYTDVGIFRTPLQATSTQSFTQEIIGLPASETGTFIFINELEKVVNGTSVKQYQEGGGAEYPWRIEITHLEDEGTSGLPENLPNWQTYLDINKPKASDDGYFRIKTPTSSVNFIYKFPETYKIKITQEGIGKLATTTFDEIDPYGTGFFTVNNIDAATGTVKWLQATVYNYEDEEVINALFPIVGLEEGELENLGYGVNENFFTRFLSSLFVPSTTYLNKFKIDLPELLKTKIPFSYFYDIKTAINDIQVGEAKEFPEISYAIAGYNFEFNPLNIAGMLESEGWATLYDLMKIACWLMFILYLFGRIRDKTTNTAD